MKVNSLFMYPSITKYQANFESTSSVINYDVSRRFLWSLTFMTIVLTVYICKVPKNSLCKNAIESMKDASTYLHIELKCTIQNVRKAFAGRA